MAELFQGSGSPSPSKKGGNLSFKISQLIRGS